MDTGVRQNETGNSCLTTSGALLASPQPPHKVFCISVQTAVYQATGTKVIHDIYRPSHKNWQWD